jgi:TrmH RNA methyltransferase
MPSSKNPESKSTKRTSPTGPGVKGLENKVCGFHAVQALFAARPVDIVRVYVVEELVPKLSPLLKFCAKNKKAYHIVSEDDMRKVSGSTHHEGVCVIAKTRPKTSFETVISELALTARRGSDPVSTELLLILEDVSNPHNVGAIVRVAAHFGARYVLLPESQVRNDVAASAALSTALLRTAEGGGEAVSMVNGPAIDEMVKELMKVDVAVLATDVKAKQTIYDTKSMPARLAIILGHEARGVSTLAKKSATSVAAIPGSGKVESLNVSAAAAVLCSEFYRRHQVKCLVAKA